MRDADGLQTIDPGLFQRDIEKIHARCPIIIEGSTGGAPEHTVEQRCISTTVPGVEMGSLNLGSINLWDGVYNNKMADILRYAEQLKKKNLVPFLDCFDLSHFSCVPKLADRGLISPPHTFGLVFDVPNALPYQDRYLDFFLQELPDASIWFLARHHARGVKGFMRAPWKKAVMSGSVMRMGPFYPRASAPGPTPSWLKRWPVLHGQSDGKS